MTNHPIINRQSKFKLGPLLELALIIFCVFICLVYLCDTPFLRQNKKDLSTQGFRSFFTPWEGISVCFSIGFCVCFTPLSQPTLYFWEKWDAVDIEDLPLPVSTKSGVTFKIYNLHLVNLLSGHRFASPLCFSACLEILNNLFLITSICYLLTFEI